jgi:hypothetical protein
VSRTPFVETEVLLAVLEDREGDAARLVMDMLRGERAAFARALDRARAVVHTPELHIEEATGATD